jgi:hypothetical protein
MSGFLFSVTPWKSAFIGKSKGDCVKPDLFYTDKPIQDIIFIDGIRMATVECKSQRPRPPHVGSNCPSLTGDF